MPNAVEVSAATDPLRSGDVAQMDAAIATMQDALARQAALYNDKYETGVSGWFQSFWSDKVLGADSARAAIRADLENAGNLLTSLQERRDRVVERGYSHADARDIVRAAGQGASFKEAEKAEQLLDAGNTVSTVAADTAHDVATGIKWGVPLVLIAAGVGFFLWERWKR